MLKNTQIRKCIIKPATSLIGLYSPSAEEQLYATAAHETLLGSYVVQHPEYIGGSDPCKLGALGIYQMETPTHNDLWRRMPPDIGHKIRIACNFGMTTTIPSTELIHNLFYATMMARVLYFLAPGHLPAVHDKDAIWAYYKKYWNTAAGAATKDAFLKNYETALAR